MVVLERELGVDCNFSSRRRKLEDAIRARAVGERALHLKRPGRQHVADEPLELHLAECAAGALVAEQLLQAYDTAGEAFDFFLRFVDRREARHDAEECFVGLAKAFVEPLVTLPEISPRRSSILLLRT